jgi:DNA-binding NarL/FixJ family response regulator
MIETTKWLRTYHKLRRLTLNNTISSQEQHFQTIAPALIVAAPGRMRQALDALLAAIPWIQIIAQADNSASALTIIKQHCPKLVLLDANLPNNQAWAFLRVLKAKYPHTRSIVLVDNLQQQAAAQSAQATVTLLKGFPISELYNIIEKLASGQTSQCYPQGEIL